MITVLTLFSGIMVSFVKRAFNRGIVDSLNDAWIKSQKHRNESEVQIARNLLNNEKKIKYHMNEWYKWWIKSGGKV